MKEDLKILAQYLPEQEEVWQTSDGLLHLTKEEAQAQAAHLKDAAIIPQPLKKPKQK